MKGLTWLKHHADTRKRLAELLHRNAVYAPRRVIQIGPVTLEPIQHNEVIELPMNDAGKCSFFPQLLRLITKALGCEAVISRGLQHIHRI